MKAQRGKIILLCLCLIFAMLIISGKASKLGTYLYVRCNYTHLEEFAAEVIQTGAIPDDRYKRRDVRYYPECGMIEFSTFSSGFGSETVYEGFYYSDEDVPFGFQGTIHNADENDLTVFEHGGWELRTGTNAAKMRDQLSDGKGSSDACGMVWPAPRPGWMDFLNSGSTPEKMSGCRNL